MSLQLHSHIEAVQAGQRPDENQLIRNLAVSCLVNGHDDSVKTHLQLVPVSCHHMQLKVKGLLPKNASKLIPHLQAEACRPYFTLIYGPSGTQPAVVPVLSALSALILKQHRSTVIDQILAALQISQTVRPSMTAPHSADGYTYLTCAAQNRIETKMTACKQVSDGILFNARHAPACLEAM